MTIKSALSVVALTVALTGSAFAQGMTINGVAVSEGDMAAVQERCDELANAESTESIASTTEDGEVSDSEDDDSNGGSNDATAGNDALVENAPGVNEAQNATTTIDLDTVSLSACVEGGFVTQ